MSARFGDYVTRQWTPAVTDGVARRFTRSGEYRAYVPAKISTMPALDAADVDLFVDVAASVTRAVELSAQSQLGSVSTLLVRSEAQGSSTIEGYPATAGNVAMTQLTGHGSHNAQVTARNVAIMHDATQAMVAADRVRLDDIVDMQSALVPALPGVRTEPVWISGATPLDVTYVAPPWEQVPELLADLLNYVNEPSDSVLVAAAVAHAGFETIHPFADGNGRIGRALIHTVLARGGLTKNAVVPVSLVLFRRREEYYRALGQWQSQTDRDGRSLWLRFFAECMIEAAELMVRLAQEVEQLRRKHCERVNAYRQEQGGRAFRSDSLTLHIIQSLPSYPALTAPKAAQWFSTSEVAARAALETLADAGILRRKKISRTKTTAYLASEILSLIDHI